MGLNILKMDVVRGETAANSHLARTLINNRRFSDLTNRWRGDLEAGILRSQHERCIKGFKEGQSPTISLRREAVMSVDDDFADLMARPGRGTKRQSVFSYRGSAAKFK